MTRYSKIKEKVKTIINSLVLNYPNQPIMQCCERFIIISQSITHGHALICRNVLTLGQNLLAQILFISTMSYNTQPFLGYFLHSQA